MRIELYFELEKNIIPSDNRAMFVSFLKKTLEECNQGKYYEHYFTGTDRKRSCFLIMEWAEAYIVTAPSFQTDIGRNKINNIISPSHFFHKILVIIHLIHSVSAIKQTMSAVSSIFHMWQPHNDPSYRQ